MSILVLAEHNNTDIKSDESESAAGNSDEDE